LSAYFAVSRHHHQKNHRREYKGQNNVRDTPPFRESPGILGQSCDHGKHRGYAKDGRCRNSQRTTPTWHRLCPKNRGIGDSSLLGWPTRHSVKEVSRKVFQGVRRPYGDIVGPEQQSAIAVVFFAAISTQRARLVPEGWSATESYPASLQRLVVTYGGLVWHPRTRSKMDRTQ